MARRRFEFDCLRPNWGTVMSPRKLWTDVLYALVLGIVCEALLLAPIQEARAAINFSGGSSLTVGSVSGSVGSVTGSVGSCTGCYPVAGYTYNPKAATASYSVSGGGLVNILNVSGGAGFISSLLFQVNGAPGASGTFNLEIQLDGNTTQTFAFNCNNTVPYLTLGSTPSIAGLISEPTSTSVQVLVPLNVTFKSSARVGFNSGTTCTGTVTGNATYGTQS